MNYVTNSIKFILIKKLCVIKILLIFFFITYSFPLTGKDFSNQEFICADETGPVVEFLMPSFAKNSLKKNNKFKLYADNDRNSFKEISGELQKKNSPIDDSYYFYTLNISGGNDILNKVYFEFYPPSTMMIQVSERQFKNLACWIK